MGTIAGMTTARRTLELTARAKDAERRSIQLLAETERIRDRMANETVHTMEEDFQHFLSYSGLSSQTLPKRGLMRRAFEAAWKPARAGKEYEKRIAELEAALKPFADAGAKYAGDEFGNVIPVKVSDLMHAAAALASKGSPTPPAHTPDDDFAHFLSRTGLGEGELPEVIAKMRAAYVEGKGVQE